MKHTELTFIPQQALVIYQNSHNSHHVLIHEITDNRLEAGVPLTPDTYEKLRYMFKGKRAQRRQLTCDSIIERKIVQISVSGKGKLRLSWIVPEQRKMYFGQNGSFTTIFPQMLFIWDGDLEIHIFKGKLNSKTITYKAPYPNVSGNGSVCLGNAKVKNLNDVSKLIDHVEELFFNTRFIGEDTFARSISNCTKFPYNKLIQNGEKLLDTILSD